MVVYLELILLTAQEKKEKREREMEREDLTSQHFLEKDGRHLNFYSVHQETVRAIVNARNPHQLTPVYYVHIGCALDLSSNKSIIAFLYYFVKYFGITSPHHESIHQA